MCLRQILFKFYNIDTLAKFSTFRQFNSMQSFLNNPNKVKVFLEDYWQKKPLLINKAFPGPVDLVSADELAGLSCEEAIESRIIIQDKSAGSWQLEHGPFDEERFATLPDDHWTLLVQDIDKHLPDAARFLQQFNFIPRWLVDDLMISYAADQGSVGPHTDSYDVFLIQLQGNRLWQISDTKYTDADLLTDSEVKVTKHFNVSEQWLLQPGDMLYLPANTGHWGIAQGECLTGSVGFASPKHSELFSSWADYMIEKIPGDSFYQDPDISHTESPALIDQATIAKVTSILQTCISIDPDQITTWFGRMISESKPHHENLLPIHNHDATYYICHHATYNMPLSPAYFHRHGDKSYVQKKQSEELIHKISQAKGFQTLFLILSYIYPE